MKIVKKFRNNLLKRDEVSSILLEQSNPGFNKARSLLASELKVTEDLIALKAVRSKFGSSEFTIEAFVYDSASDKQRVEPQPKAAPKKEGGQ